MKSLSLQRVDGERQFTSEGDRFRNLVAKFEGSEHYLYSEDVEYIHGRIKAFKERSLSLSKSNDRVDNLFDGAEDCFLDYHRRLVPALQSMLRDAEEVSRGPRPGGQTSMMAFKISNLPSTGQRTTTPFEVPPPGDTQLDCMSWPQMRKPRLK
jgi:hypothetical protein